MSLHPSARPTAARYGRLAVVSQLVLAAMLGAVSTMAGVPSPEPVPRGLALALLFSVPAAIGYLGTVGERRALLVSAAVLDVVGAPLSWAGVTLIFLIPAILFLAAATRVARPRSAWSVLGGIAVVVAVVALAVAAGVVLLAWTEPLCWIARSTPSGTSFEIVPTIEGVPFGSGEGGGCTSAALEIEGAFVAAALALVAIGLSWLTVGGPGLVRTPSVRG